MTSNIRTHLQTATVILALIATGFVLLVSVDVSSTDAYEGPFCYEEVLKEGEGCESVTRSEIRRAIGHTVDAETGIGIETNKGKVFVVCEGIECEANTKYLKEDGTGNGYIYNEGPNGTRKSSGYLYP